MCRAAGCALRWAVAHLSFILEGRLLREEPHVLRPAFEGRVVQRLARHFLRCVASARARVSTKFLEYNLRWNNTTCHVYPFYLGGGGGGGGGGRRRLWHRQTTARDEGPTTCTLAVTAGKMNARLQLSSRASCLEREREREREREPPALPLPEWQPPPPSTSFLTAVEDGGFPRTRLDGSPRSSRATAKAARCARGHC